MLPRRAFLSLAAAAPAALAATRIPTTIADAAQRMFPTPGKNPNGLQATPAGLWVYDQGNNHAALLNWADGKVLRDFNTETDKGSGITFDGTHIWIASTYDSRIVRTDPTTGKALQSFPCPGSGVVHWGPRGPKPRATGAHGLEFRNGELWIAVPPAMTIYVVNPADGAVKRSFPAPGVRPHGIGWDPDGSLWCAESIYRSFFKVDPKSGALKHQLALPLREPLVDDLLIVPHGMTVHDRHIWFSVAETAEVYRLPLP
ncbi:MAG: hypothetical protein J0L64_24215 [Acidobacteria bacterium]|nr:hypothetical protein [Acidobacteriota bacterium]